MLAKLRFGLKNINERVTNSAFGRYFEMEERNTTLFQELRAGVVCFLSVCYIIPVNAGILADTGGTCVPEFDCSKERWDAVGPSCAFDSAGTNPQWGECIASFKQSLIASTCIASMLATLCMGIFARMPMALAPAMGVNAYFTYTIVGYMGTGLISYQAALAAAFVEGCIFILISASGLRSLMVELIPKSLMYATAAGIGSFLAFIGLQGSQGLGVIGYDGATLVALAGCPPEEQGSSYMMREVDSYWLNFCFSAWQFQDTNDTLTSYTDQYALNYFTSVLNLTSPFNPSLVCSQYIFGSSSPVPLVQYGLPAPSAAYGCMGHSMQSLTMWLGIFGGAIMVLLMARGVPAAILWGILFTTFISWIPYPNKTTYFGDQSTLPGGADRYSYFLKGATVPNVGKSGGVLNFNALSHGNTWLALISFLYLDFMDATSTMYTLAGLVAEKVPGFRNEKGEWPRQIMTMCCDGFAIIIGSTLGTSPLTVFAESTVGVKEGGRTGVVALVVAFGFGISMFLSPIFSSIPPYATGPAIIFVGALMMEHAAHVEWNDINKAVPAFLTILLMPLTYSIAYGIIGGMCATLLLWLCNMVIDFVLAAVYKNMTMRQVYLDSFSHLYRAFGKEQVLVDELPGYVSPHTLSGQKAAVEFEITAAVKPENMMKGEEADLK